MCLVAANVVLILLNTIEIQKLKQTCFAWILCDNVKKTFYSVWSFNSQNNPAPSYGTDVRRHHSDKRTNPSASLATSAHRWHSWSHTELVRRRHRGQRCNDVRFTARENEASLTSPRPPDASMKTNKNVKALARSRQCRPVKWLRLQLFICKTYNDQNSNLHTFYLGLVTIKIILVVNFLKINY